MSPAPALPTEMFARMVEGLMEADLRQAQAEFFGWLVFSTKVVVVGVILEGPELVCESFALIKSWRDKRREKSDLKTLAAIFPDAETSVAVEPVREHPPAPKSIMVVALLGWMLVVLGVAGEWVAEVWVENANSAVQTFDAARLLAAQKAAASAEISAEGAANAASRAKGEADQAAGIANTAGATADVARRKGTELESDLRAQGVSLQKLISSGKEDLAVIKMSRQIQNPQDWFSSLSVYKGTEYAFAEIFPDAESIRLLAFIDSLLQRAGWKRVAVPASEIKGAPMTISLFSDCPNCFIPVSAKEGVGVEVEEPNPPSAPVMTPLYSLPEYVRAASALHKELFGGIFPRDGSADSQYLITLKGDSRVVLISVGSKPEPVEPYDPKVWQKMMEARQNASQATKP